MDIYIKRILWCAFIYHTIMFILCFINLNTAYMLLFFWMMFDIVLILSDSFDWEIYSMELLLLRIIFLCVVQQIVGLENIDPYITIVLIITIIGWAIAVIFKIEFQNWWWSRK